MINVIPNSLGFVCLLEAVTMWNRLLYSVRPDAEYVRPVSKCVLPCNHDDGFDYTQIYNESETDQIFSSNISSE